MVRELEAGFQLTVLTLPLTPTRTTGVVVEA